MLCALDLLSEPVNLHVTVQNSPFYWRHLGNLHNVSFEVNSFPERTAQLPSSVCCRCLASRLTLESSDRCGHLHIAHSVFFLYKLGPRAQVWHHPSELDPSTSIVGQENAQQLPIGQSYGRIFSITLAYIKQKGGGQNFKPGQRSYLKQ